MSEATQDLAQFMDELFQSLESAAADEQFDALIEGGFLSVGIDPGESAEGGDSAEDAGSILDAAALWASAAKHAIALPVAEEWLARWVLGHVGQGERANRLALVRGGVIEGDSSGSRRLHGSIDRVASARDAREFVVVTDRDEVVVVAAEKATVEHGENLYRESRDRVTFVRVDVDEPASIPGIADRVLLLGALIRAIQIAELARAAQDLTVAHVTAREQFNRPLSSFQAVQQSLAELVGEVTVMRIATKQALHAFAEGNDTSPLAIAAAKLNAHRAAEKVASIAHQLHGAMGTTEEYPLARLTLRMRAWRYEFGDDARWESRLIAEIGDNDTWAALTR